MIRPALTLAVALLCAVPFPAMAQVDTAPAARAIPTEIEEQVRVILAEVEILVTDKDGNAITDLRHDEISVREAGRSCPVAYLESFATSDLSARLAAGPVALFRTVAEAQGEPQGEPSSQLLFPAPPPQRWIVLLFDVHNSRTPDRVRWVEAARSWVEDEMRPSDRVSLALLERAAIRVVIPFTASKEALLGHLANESIVRGGQYHDYMIEIRTLLDDLETCVTAYEPEMCALSAVQTYLHEWRVRTEQTIGALRRFAASLAAIPGRKAVFYMSDGLVVDAGELATNAILAKLGTDTLSYSRTSASLSQDLSFDVLQALGVASTADVTFFTFDTRNSNLRDVSWMAEERVSLHERRASDPFALMFDTTRGSLDTMAIQTGGRSYHGPQIEKNLPRAVRAFEGLYTVGYSRDAATRGDPKVKVSVSRKGAVVSYPKRSERWRTRLPTTARLELGLVNAEPSVEGLLVPVAVQIPVSDLSFSKKAGQVSAEVALYAEALSTAGERIAERFEIVSVQLSAEAFEKAGTAGRFTHTLGLLVAPGAYRIRVRVSEADFRHAAERSVDVTVRPDGSIVPGIRDSGPSWDLDREPAGRPDAESD